MAERESLDGCHFFNDKLDDMPAMADMYKKKYCLGDKSSCARYMVKTELGKDKVPSDLSLTRPRGRKKSSPKRTCRYPFT